MGTTRDKIENSRELITNTVATDVELALKLDKTGGTISSDLTVSGNFTVNGDTTTVNTTTVTAEDNIITINFGETGAGVTAGSSGIEVDRGTETNYEFKFDESDDSFKIGQIGGLQKVATREDTPIDVGVAQWDATSKKFVTSIGPTLDSVDVTNSIVVGGTVDGRDVAADGTKLDNVVSGTQGITFDNTVSGLTAVLVKEAIDEVDSDLDVLESTVGTLETDINVTAATKLAAMNLLDIAYNISEDPEVLTYAGVDNKETISYGVDGPTNIEHVIDNVIIGNTVITYTSGNPTSEVYSDV